MQKYNHRFGLKANSNPQNGQGNPRNWGMGRIISNIGRTKRLTVLYQPISQPKGTPITIARSSPLHATFKLTRIFVCSREPSGLLLFSLSNKAANTFVGAGRILSDSIPAVTKPCQMSKKSERWVRRLPHTGLRFFHNQPPLLLHCRNFIDDICFKITAQQFGIITFLIAAVLDIE